MTRSDLMFFLQVVDTVFMVYMIMLFVRIISSWFPDYRDHTAVRFVSFYTDPYLNAFKRVIPPLGMMDFSPIIAFFALHLIEGFVKAIVVQLFL